MTTQERNGQKLEYKFHKRITNKCETLHHEEIQIIMKYYFIPHMAAKMKSMKLKQGCRASRTFSYGYDNINLENFLAVSGILNT
jgi:hypothetical protein